MAAAVEWLEEVVEQEGVAAEQEEMAAEQEDVAAEQDDMAAEQEEVAAEQEEGVVEQEEGVVEWKEEAFVEQVDYWSQGVCQIWQPSPQQQERHWVAQTGLAPSVAQLLVLVSDGTD